MPRRIPRVPGDGGLTGTPNPLEARLAAQCAAADAGYPDNAGLVIDEKARPCLKKRRALRPTETAVALEAALRERMPERTLLGIFGDDR